MSVTVCRRVCGVCCMRFCYRTVLRGFVQRTRVWCVGNHRVKIAVRFYRATSQFVCAQCHSHELALICLWTEHVTCERQVLTDDTGWDVNFSDGPTVLKTTLSVFLSIENY